ncbi:MAG: hypothetical protein WDN75_09555 [Bacteroidota bacterium]
MFASHGFDPGDAVINTVTYYDDSSFRSMFIGSVYDYLPGQLEPQVSLTGTYTQPARSFTAITGLVAATKVRVLGQSTYLLSVNYYDDRYRLIQVVADNLKGGRDRTTSIFDFSGKALATRTSHSISGLTWKDIVGIAINGQSLTSNASGWGSAGAASVQALPANTDGWMQVTVAETNTDRMIGFSAANSDANYASIDYALYMAPGIFSVFESGQNKYQTTGLTSGDILRIERINDTIRYYRNGILAYTSETPSTSSLLLDASFYAVGSTITNIMTSFSADSETNISRKFTYDHARRLLETRYSINGATPVLLAKNEYNELGQLVDKKLHSADNGSSFKQSTDYRYNIRGWLTAINNSSLANDGITNDDTNDLFGMELGYNKSIDTGNDLLFNGNISGMKWSQNLALGSIKEAAYNYRYDAMNRITGAAYQEKSMAWGGSDSFSESGYEYDLNGNIKKLRRRGPGGSLMDNLTYDYGTASSNKLLKVSDTGDRTKGFVEIALAQGNDYGYDKNGNMVFDQNKSITWIDYNYLNLPQRITKNTNEFIRYIYDASGRKLRQEVYSSIGSFKKSTDYSGEFFYENDTLKFINHEEGRGSDDQERPRSTNTT